MQVVKLISLHCLSDSLLVIPIFLEIFENKIHEFTHQLGHYRHAGVYLRIHTYLKSPKLNSLLFTTKLIYHNLHIPQKKIQ